MSIISHHKEVENMNNSLILSKTLYCDAAVLVRLLMHHKGFLAAESLLVVKGLFVCVCPT